MENLFDLRDEEFRKYFTNSTLHFWFNNNDLLEIIKSGNITNNDLVKLYLRTCNFNIFNDMNIILFDYKIKKIDFDRVSRFREICVQIIGLEACDKIFNCLTGRPSYYNFMSNLNYNVGIVEQLMNILLDEV